jgi:hypothetical protein
LHDLETESQSEKEKEKERRKERKKENESHSRNAHYLQRICCCCTIPGPTCRISSSIPAPLQVGHFFTALLFGDPTPLHSLQMTFLLNSKSFCTPENASSRVIRTEC